MTNYLIYFILIISGVILGCIISDIHYHLKTTFGVLKVDRSDPDGPFLFLELTTEAMDNIDKQNYIRVKIKNIKPRK